MFALAGPWIDSLEAGLVVVVDELHQNLYRRWCDFSWSAYMIQR